MTTLNGLHWTLKCILIRRGGLRCTGKPIPTSEIPGRIKAIREAAKAEAKKKLSPPKKVGGNGSDGDADRGTGEDGGGDGDVVAVATWWWW